MSSPLDRLLAEVIEVGEPVDSQKTADAYLRKLCKYRTEIQLYFEQSAQHYKSRILDVDDTSLLLDQLLPEEGNQLLAEGQQPALLANIDGICLCCPKLPTTTTIEEGEDQLHRCNRPLELMQIQRRDAFRVRMRQNEPITVELELEEHCFRGEMLDLSASGCRCLVRFGQHPPLKVGDRFQLRFSLPDGTAIECTNEARHCIAADPLKQPGFFLLGVQFLRLSGMHERQISLLISRLQREERQLNTDS